MNKFIIVILAISISENILFLYMLLCNRIFFKNEVILQNKLMKITFIFFLIPGIILSFIYIVKITPVISKVSGADIHFWISYIGENNDNFEWNDNGLGKGVFYAWLIGFIIVSLRKINQNIKLLNQMFLLSYKEEDQKINLIKEKILDELKISKKIDIYRSNLAISPCIYGIFHMKIFLPHEDFSEIEIELILKHELFHYKRQDIWLNLLISLFSCIYWFNPIIRLYTQSLYNFGEMSCDQYVLRNTSKDIKIVYANLLVKTSEKMIKNEICKLTAFISQDEKFMKRRLYNIMRNNTKIKKLILIGGICSTLILCPVTTYAATLGITNMYNKVLSYTNLYKTSDIKENKRFQADYNQQVETIVNFSLENRGSNPVDMKIKPKGKSQSDQFIVKKNGTIKVFISGEQTEDKFKVIIKSGNVEKVSKTSSNGDINYTYTADSTDSYTVTIINSSSKTIHITGSIIIN